jgi:hypothetical protein
MRASRAHLSQAAEFPGVEAELRDAGDFKTTFVGDMPVVVTRDEARAQLLREPLRASRALLCLKDRGSVEGKSPASITTTTTCRAISPGRLPAGIKGRRMPEDALPGSAAQASRDDVLRPSAALGSTPPFERYIGAEVAARSGA